MSPSPEKPASPLSKNVKIVENIERGKSVTYKDSSPTHRLSKIQEASREEPSSVIDTYSTSRDKHLNSRNRIRAKNLAGVPAIRITRSGSLNPTNFTIMSHGKKIKGVLKANQRRVLARS